MTLPQFGTVPGQQISLPVSAVPPGMSPTKPMPSTISGPRSAGSVAPARLPRAAHLEYDAFIQSRIRSMTQQGVPAAGVPMSAVGVPAQGTLHTTIASGVMGIFLLTDPLYDQSWMYGDDKRRDEIRLKKSEI